MHITLSPSRRDDRLTLSREGDTLTINGEVFDFTPLPDGATLPREAIDSDWFAGPVERVGGVLHLSIILPHGAKASLETLFPTPIVLAGDGPVDLPAYEMETPDTVVTGSEDLGLPAPKVQGSEDGVNWHDLEVK